MPTFTQRTELMMRPRRFALALAILVPCSSSCTAQAWRDMADATNQAIEADNQKRREAAAAEDARCLREPDGYYVVGLLNIAALPTKPNGTTWDADLQGVETLVGSAARVAAVTIAGQSGIGAIAPALSERVATQVEGAFTQAFGTALSSLKAPDMELRIMLNGDQGRALAFPKVQDSYQVVFSRPQGFLIEMRCGSTHGQNVVRVDATDADLLENDPMFSITFDAYAVAMAGGDGKKGAVVIMGRRDDLGLASAALAVLPVGAEDAPIVHQE